VIHTFVGAPGLTADTGMADLVVELLSSAGLPLDEKATLQNTRVGLPSFAEATHEQRGKSLGWNPKYAHIVCRCELVSETEIREAVRRAQQHGRCEKRYACQHGSLSGRVLP
jgi:glycerol-3-phosphate dehydrogenase